RLGMAYLNPQGGAEPDPALALKWIQRAADQGYADAQYALGAVHHAGRGALQSFPVAVKWFELAAQQNHADAQYSLGVMYRTGQGVPVDKSKAYIWFNLSAAQGHPRAREARDSLLTSLSPDQVLAAQRTAQEWRPGKALK
ncbi:MAG: sel1 repeat family protein, partial [Burkholderiaceae bacterium]|nr:sel1 repeat family protein [Burkholderiaceae bacterium]